MTGVQVQKGSDSPAARLMAPGPACPKQTLGLKLILEKPSAM